MIVQLVYWSLVGWCGTPWPRPKGPPWPWWRNLIIGIVGGIAGGYLVNIGLGFDELVATSFGAFAGGKIISDVLGSYIEIPVK